MIHEQTFFIKWGGVQQAKNILERKYRLTPIAIQLPSTHWAMAMPFPLLEVGVFWRKMVNRWYFFNSECSDNTSHQYSIYLYFYSKEIFTGRQRTWSPCSF